mmetsp:Transcript_38371/g.90201  ORF Transcript_38371/g.90201 Transcript_38371/m.90201 type:complete len:594 (+) Transcript_38371:111-1892(+)
MNNSLQQSSMAAAADGRAGQGSSNAAEVSVKLLAEQRRAMQLVLDLNNALGKLLEREQASAATLNGTVALDALRSSRDALHHLKSSTPQTPQLSSPDVLGRNLLREALGASSGDQLASVRSRNQSASDGSPVRKWSIDDGAIKAIGDSLREPLLSERQVSEGEVLQDGKPGTKPFSARSLERRTNNVFAARKADVVPPKSFKEKAKADQNIEDMYSDTGFFQAVARSNNFQNITLIIIVINTLWMAVDTDFNKADVLCNAPLLFQVADNLFCFYFTFEIMARFFAFRRKLDALKDFWFVSDSSLVLLMIWETWIQVIIYLFAHDDSAATGMRSASVLRLFRAFRLLRISRMSRLLRSLPELFILVKSIGAAVRCMFVTLCMLVIIVYIYSIMFTQLLSGAEVAEGHFDTVPEAMNFMLLQVLCGFDTEFVSRLLHEGGLVYYALWLTYVLIGSLSIMNVLIGILCEVVSGTAGSEKEAAVRKELELAINSASQISQLPCSDAADAFLLSKKAMVSILENQSVVDKIEELGVDVPALLDFVHFFGEEEQRHLASFVEMIVQFRGSKTATVKDIVDLRKFFTMEAQVLEERLRAR